MSKIKEIPVTERPYERCMSSGPSILTDAELLAIILRTGTQNKDVLELAYSIINIDGTNEGILGLLHHSKEQYLSLKGIGKVKAIQLLCIGELAKRIWNKEASVNLDKFNEPSLCAAYYMQELRHLEQEELRIVYLDTALKFIDDTVITRGTVDSSLVSVREILIDALKHRAVKLIMVHNHPSGNPTPSSFDRQVTEKVKEACEIVGMDLIDHIIIGDNKYYSFREWGIL